MVLEHAFHDEIANHFKLKPFSCNIGWEKLLTLRDEFYLDLVRELYANMLHKYDKHLLTIIFFVKGVHITLTRESLARLLGIQDKDDMLTVDINQKRIEEDPSGV